MSKTTLSRSISDALIKETDRLNKHYLGRLLTLVDASFSDPEQRKAFKDVMKEVLRDSADYTYNMISEITSDMAEIVGDERPVPSRREDELTLLFVNKESLGYTYARKEK